MASIGLPWMAVQSVAWVSMAVTYSLEKGSVFEGLSDTLDGEHPCALCGVVEKAVKKDQKEQKESGKKKFDMLPARQLSMSPPDAAMPLEVPLLCRKWVKHPSAPPVPPPRMG